MNLLTVVQTEINKALADTGSIHGIYLDRFAEVERCSREIEDVDEPDYTTLWGDAPNPNFEVCTVCVGGTILAHGGDTIDIGDDDALQAAIDSAVAECKRFYTEREQECGSTAWPMTRSVGVGI